MSVVQEIVRLVRETAHFANSAKNSTSIFLGDYLALTNLYTGQLMCVDTRDRSVAPHLLMKGEWEFHYGEYFRSLVQRDSSVLDAGANFGYFGLLASMENSRGRTSYVEANPGLLEILRQNIFMNGYSRKSMVFGGALTEADGNRETLVIPGEAWGSATLGGELETEQFKEGYGLESKILEVPTVTIDALVTAVGSPFDVIKLDIERGEERALIGASSLLQQENPLHIFMEYSFGSPGNPVGVYSENFFENLIGMFSEIRLVMPDGTAKKITRSDQLVYEEGQVFSMVHLIK